LKIFRLRKLPKVRRRKKETEKIKKKRKPPNSQKTGKQVNRLGRF
jgi:hypothetical protein